MMPELSFFECVESLILYYCDDLFQSNNDMKKVHYLISRILDKVNGDPSLFSELRE